MRRSTSGHVKTAGRRSFGIQVGEGRSSRGPRKAHFFAARMSDPAQFKSRICAPPKTSQVIEPRAAKGGIVRPYYAGNWVALTSGRSRLSRRRLAARRG